MSAMETSAAETRGGYRRFFAWTAAISLLLMLAMIALEVLFPQGIRIFPQPSSALADALGAHAGTMEVDIYDFQLLIMVVSLVSCVASIVGLLVVAFIDSIESRKVRRRRTVEARRTPPRNARLSALREAVHELE